MDAKISICHELFSFKKCKKLRRGTAAFKALLEGTVWYISIRDAAALLAEQERIQSCCVRWESSVYRNFCKAPW